MEPATDAAEIDALLTRIAARDAAAFWALYDTMSPVLFALCLSILKDRRAAEEALAEAFIRIWQHAGRFAEQGLSGRAWVITLTRNRALARLGGRRRSEDPGEGYGIPSSRRPPETASRAALLPQLGQLAGDDEATLRALYLEGQGYCDIAVARGRTLPELRAAVRRVLLSLRSGASA